MNMLERLEELMKQKSVNKRQLALKTGIPPTTVYGWWDKGFENMTLPTLGKLASFFDCSMEYLVSGEQGKSEEYNRLSGDERELVDIYRNLDKSAKQLLIATARTFAGNPNAQKEADRKQAI